MPLPDHDTIVTFPSGGLTDHAEVLAVRTGDGRTQVITTRTPFHPVDFRWPDQGPDRGTAAIGGRSFTVSDCVIGATDGSELFVGEAVPVRRGEEGWAFVVVHHLAVDATGIAEGDEVLLTVDAEHRRALSAGHTACHLAALALNAALADRWRKPVGTDGLGNPDFDQLAIVSSRIEPGGAVDRYRMGRSLRKKGFDIDGLAADLMGIAGAANTTLAGWVATGAPVQLLVAGPGLTDLREWVCALPEGTQRIPCGGTHLDSLAETGGVTVTLEYDEAEGSLVMQTTVGA